MRNVLARGYAGVNLEEPSTRRGEAPMGKKARKKGDARTAATSQGPSPSRPVVVATVLIVSLIVTAGWWVLTRPATGPGTERGQPVTAGAAAAPASGSGGPSSSLRASFEPDKLTGRWQRSDGGYVIEIRSVAADGALDAGYFNPAPIHVSQARLTSPGGKPQVFVELRDVNYPGSTYTLTYDGANDQLAGVYFQAVEQQQFDVVFVRQR